ncbi:hypothetical protein NX794_30750 [Streptomyces sp. LP11]|uniref:Uncharacterized protein n=1 Tax=Streptomyces pyxinicus TaxID=2970331 RepID=A0ABT2BAZ1_9ACTN|nr:hypothetical protein [Streptomyces sp. LP11]MCS0605551.1 hypothetical protein [Streptomyces sp. LP11]
MRTGRLRAIGAVTFVYGIATACRPGLLARPSGLVERHGGVAPHTAMVLRPMAWRDAASGLAMVVAPDGPALATASALRIASDVGDALLLGRTLSGRVRRTGAVASALGWAALTAVNLLGRPDTARYRAGH